MTTVYVTHDRDEAMSLADGVVVLRDGRIEQTGAPRDLYERPANRFVAEFLGEVNFVDGEVGERRGATVSIRTQAGPLASAVVDGAEAVTGAVLVCMRPEALHLVAGSADGTSAGLNRLRGLVASTTYLGDTAQHLVECQTVSLKVTESNPRRSTRVGEVVTLAIDPEQVVLLPRS